MTDLGPLTHVIARTRTRVRFQRAMEAATIALCVWFALGGVARVVQRVFYYRAQNESLWFAGLAVLVAAFAFFWPVRRESIATRIDLSHAFHDRVRTALDFAQRKDCSGFMDAAIQDAVARAHMLSPKQAAPFHAPRARYVAMALLLLWLGAGALPARELLVVEQPKVTPAIALSQDELSAFQEELSTVEAKAPASVEAEAQRAAYRALLDRIAQGELDRTAAIEALLSMEKRLLSEPKYDLSAEKSAFGELARDLAKSDEALSGALLKQDAEAAAKALEALAQSMEGKSAEERARLKAALERVKRRAEENAARERREAELESLLKRRQEPQTPDEKRLLERNKRELERLRRENQAARERSRELSRLERNLSQASDALDANAMQDAQDAMQRAAEDLRRMGQDQGTREQQEALAKQVAQLRELLQRKREQNGSKGQDQKPSGGSQEERRKRFTLRAAGQDPDAEEQKLLAPKSGKPGEQGEEGGEGEGQKPGEKEGGKQGKSALVLGGDGPANAEIELPFMQQIPSGSQPMASDEHDTRRLRQATDMDSELRDSQVAGTASKGPVRSEVILDAADRGFATAPYRKVYSDYRMHAEEVLDKEDIPSGYRFYVRRYFQLIRPREERKAP